MEQSRLLWTWKWLLWTLKQTDVEYVGNEGCLFCLFGQIVYADNRLSDTVMCRYAVFFLKCIKKTIYQNHKHTTFANYKQQVAQNRTIFIWEWYLTLAPSFDIVCLVCWLVPPWNFINVCLRKSGASPRASSLLLWRMSEKYGKMAGSKTWAAWKLFLVCFWCVFFP